MMNFPMKLISFLPNIGAINLNSKCKVEETEKMINFFVRKWIGVQPDMRKAS